MDQNPKPPKPEPEVSDHDFMERIFGKRIMKLVDAILGDDSESVDSKASVDVLAKE